MSENDKIQTEAPEAEPSLREDLEHAFKELKDKGEAPKAEKEAKEPKEQKAEPDSGERSRDDKGRFAAQKGEVKPAKEAKEPVAQPDLQAPVQSTPAPLKAPRAWSAEAKAEFDKLPPIIQQEVVRRESEAEKKITSQDADREFGKQIREVSRPYDHIIQMEGTSHAAAFQDYLRTAATLRQGTPVQKRNALLTIAQMFNVDLGVPLQQGYVPPVVESLQQRLDRLEMERQAEVQQRQYQEQAQLQGEIEAFGTDPQNAYFNHPGVKPLMGSLLESGQATGLPDAYQQAIWAIPELRSTLLAEEKRKSDEKRVTEAQAKADAAKRAAVSVTGGPGGLKPNGKDGAERSLEDELRANFRSATGRV